MQKIINKRLDLEEARERIACANDRKMSCTYHGFP
jgi:hypothetical protein